MEDTRLRRRHDHSSMDMSMGSMSSGGGVPPLLEFPKIYYSVVGVTVAIAAVANLIYFLQHRQRLNAARNGQPTPSKPKNWFFRAFATTTAIFREGSSASMDPIRIWRFTIPMPTVGKMSLVVANIIVLVVLCFVGFPNTQARSSLEDIGYRTGFVSIAQIPLLFLLAGKNNIIGFLTGLSYERLNWLHRWCARCLFLTTTIHFGYWLTDWWPYGSFVGRKITGDPITRKGFIAWIFLLWIVLSSMAPIRGLSYEFFVLQHLVSFALFVGFVMAHTPKEVHVYVWIPIGLFFFDRIVRAGYVIYTNVSFFHPKQRREGSMKGLWACKAEFTPLPHNTTKITICNPPISWYPGQHVFVSCHSVIPLQSHPFTISSIPEDGKMEFFIKAERGGTKRLFSHAEKKHNLPTSSTAVELRAVAIEGPFGRMRPLRQFDSIVLFAGSTGATFTMPLLRDIVAGWNEWRSGAPGTWLRPSGVVTRHVRFVWVVKSRGQLGWFSSQLAKVTSDVAQLRSGGVALEVDMSVYCTCDDEFTEEHKFLLSSLGSTKVTSVGHGKVEEVGGRHDGAADEKAALKKIDEQHYAEREVSSEDSDRDGIEQDEPGCGGPSGTCCCKSTIEDEDAINPTAQPCCCGAAPKSESKTDDGKPDEQNSTRSGSTDAASVTEKLLLHPSISLFAGRPTSRNIIRKTLEQALGESAVVVCGPQGLVDDVRNSAIRLSDERAVHKGTGAQGIYLHCESFKY